MAYPRRTDAEVTAALIASGGWINAAARALGMTGHGLSTRLASRPDLWPHGVPRRPRGGPRLEDADREVTTRAIRDAGGNVAAAARALGITKQGLTVRLRSHPELWPEGVPRRRPARGAQGAP